MRRRPKCRRPKVPGPCTCRRTRRTTGFRPCTGAHQVAQKLTSSGFPLKSASLTSWPSMFFSTKSRFAAGALAVRTGRPRAGRPARGRTADDRRPATRRWPRPPTRAPHHLLRPPSSARHRHFHQITTVPRRRRLRGRGRRNALGRRHGPATASCPRLCAEARTLLTVARDHAIGRVRRAPAARPVAAGVRCKMPK